MSDLINKIVSLIVIFVLCVICPLSYTYMSSEKQSERELINKTKSTLDKFTSAEIITDEDLDSMYKELNSFGISVDSQIEKYTVTDENDYVLGDMATAYDEMMYETDGEESNSYLSQYNCTNFDELKRVASSKYKYIIESGDIIKLKVKGITKTSGSRFIEKVVGINKEKIEFSLAAMKR